MLILAAVLVGLIAWHSCCHMNDGQTISIQLQIFDVSWYHEQDPGRRRPLFTGTLHQVPLTRDLLDQMRQTQRCARHWTGLVADASHPDLYWEDAGWDSERGLLTLRTGIGDRGGELSRERLFQRFHSSRYGACWREDSSFVGSMASFPQLA